LPRNNYYFCSRNNLGNLIEAGLPNIAGTTQFGNIENVSYPYAITNASGAFYGYSQGLVANVGGNSTDGYDRELKFDASRFNPIYGHSSTVQPLSVSCYLMIYCN